MIPLTMAAPGQTHCIRRITGRDAVRRRLSELGFAVGSPVVVVTQAGGNLILSVRDTRVALGRDMANRIMV